MNHKTKHICRVIEKSNQIVLKDIIVGTYHQPIDLTRFVDLMGCHIYVEYIESNEYVTSLLWNMVDVVMFEILEVKEEYVTIVRNRNFGTESFAFISIDSSQNYVPYNQKLVAQYYAKSPVNITFIDLEKLGQLDYFGWDKSIYVINITSDETCCCWF